MQHLEENKKQRERNKDEPFNQAKASTSNAKTKPTWSITNQMAEEVQGFEVGRSLNGFPQEKEDVVHRKKTSILKYDSQLEIEGAEREKAIEEERQANK